jgi:hypothetical protein
VDLLRKVNNSCEMSWHKGRVFVSEIFRFRFSASTGRSRLLEGLFSGCGD